MATPAHWLYRAYHYGADVRHFLARRVRRSGIALGLTVLIVGFIGLGHPRDSVYQIFSLAVGMGLIGILWATTRRVRITATRDLPRYATVNETLRYSVTIRNLGKNTARRAWLAESAPDHRPSRREFTSQREPGEERRNLFDRTFVYYRWNWLMLRNRQILTFPSHDEIRLSPGESQRITLQLTPLRRGVTRLDDLRVNLPDPFLLFQRSRKIPAPTATITVLPKRHPLPALELPGRNAYQIGDDTTSNAIGNTGEFVSLRDYRPGDPLRQIHWKSWARTNRPIVKELEDSHYPRYGLVLDTFSETGADTAFEAIISTAASFAATLDRSDTLLDLMFIKHEAHRVTAGRGWARAEKLMEVLAGATPETEFDFEPLAQLILRHREDLTSCLVLLLGWDEKRAAFLRQLTHAGLACVPLVIGTGERPAAAPGYWIDAENLARDLASLPTRLRAT
ncbi:MAG: DUF58 domain-containing protein [Luteolibacter sp.]